MEKSELTKEKALDLTIEMWTCLAETGNPDKKNWPKYEEYQNIIKGYYNCFLCSDANHGFERTSNLDCSEKCLYFGYYNKTCWEPNSNYDIWESTCDNDTDIFEDNLKEYASKFLEELIAIKENA